MIRYEPATIEHAVIIASDRGENLESHRYYFEFDNGLLATGTLLSSPGQHASTTIRVLLQDDGQRTAGSAVLAHLESDEDVLTLDLLFTGDAAPDSPDRVAQVWSQRSLYTQLLSSAGQRALGLESAQLVAIGHWLGRIHGAQTICVTARGMRSQVIALAASALEPQLFSSLDVDRGLATLRYLLDKPVTYQQAPDLFCRDLYEFFDIDQLVALSDARITHRFLPAIGTQNADLANRPFYGTCSYAEVRLGDEYRAMRNNSLAELSFRRAIASAPQWALPYRRLADLFVAQHAYQKASEVCRAFATAHPAASEAVYFRTLADNLAGKIGKQEKGP